MGDVLCNISAFRFHRIPPQVQMLLPMLPAPELDRNRCKLVRHPLISEVLGCPVHLLHDGSHCSYAGSRVVEHTWSGALPRAAIMDTNMGIEVASPLFTLLTLAPDISECRLVMAMYELCGTFSVFQPSSALETLLERAYAERMLDASFGWRRMIAANGKKTNLWERPPLIDVQELDEYAHDIAGMRGAKIFARAARCVTGITASPLEVQASMLLGIGRRRGGRGFRLKNNVEISMNRSARVISGKSKRVADIVITGKDGERSVILECQGEAFHGSVSARIKDSDRITALQSMGHEVIQVTYAQLCDPNKFSVLAKLIERLLGETHRSMTASQTEKERLIRSEIFVPWESF